uniref:Ubiquitin-like domain-containing protein n=1 Tax=Panagrellus redivivus TaxID=6233 RepID=A0A7E4V4I1_PANRE
MGRQYLEELSSIPSFLKLDIVGMSIKMTIVVQSGNDIQSVPIEVAKFLRQLKAGMVTTKISALEFRLHFCFYGGAPFKPQDRTAVLDHSELQEFNIEEGSFGLFYAMPRATEFFACILSF